MNEWTFVYYSLVAGIVACLACGCGALPLLLPRLDVKRHIGIGYGFAGGMMIAASVYNLLLPALTMGSEQASRTGPVLQTLAGLFMGCTFLWLIETGLTPERLQSRWLKPLGGRTEALIFAVMTLHSIPEGVAVGVGFASESYLDSASGLGLYIAIAIAIHNVPEGLAVALPLRSRGASFWKCFWFATLTSLPQPLAAVPASLAVWFFKPLMLPMLGFAAGAMMYLVIVELIPNALETRSRTQIAWCFMIGFGAMALVQLGM